MEQWFYLNNVGKDDIHLNNTGKDGIQLNKVSNNILAENFISYVNEFVLTKSNWKNSQLSVQSNLPKHYSILTH